MATTKNTKKTKKSGKKFAAEKTQKVEVKKIIRDERSHKILGTTLIVLAVLLFISFTSYLFTWKQDQSKVIQGADILWPSNEDVIENALGAAGAYVSDFFFRSGFGIASYLICLFFVVVGVNLFSGKKIFNIGRNLRYVIGGLFTFSVTASFLTHSVAPEAGAGTEFFWGGRVGDMINEWLQRMLGFVGTAAVLLLVISSYLIWRFNPTFQFSRQKLMPSLGQWKRFKDQNDDETEAPVSKPTDRAVPNSTYEDEVFDPEPPFDVVSEEPQEELPEATLVIQPQKPNPRQSVGVSDMQLVLKNDLTQQEEEDHQPEKLNVTATTDPYDPSLELRNYKFPTLDLLDVHGNERIHHDAGELEANKDQIINTLKNYDIEIQKIFATVGPTVTLYEIIPAPGVRISRIKNLEDDIALSLAALGIRIIAPIPGKGTIGIEVPNKNKTIVSMRTMLNSDKFNNNKFVLPIAIGKGIDNENFIVDLASMPHLLMAGATGQGKSVGLNAILVSLLYKKHPSQLKLVLIDPKKVELSIYKTIENHFLAKLPNEEDAIITDTTKVIHTLNALCIEMDNRYDLLKEAGTRNIKEYNQKFVARKLNPEKGHQFLPFIVLVIDEFADLIMTAGKEVEMPIARLAQLARAVGIHLIIATQRPSVNIITGTIKANFPARIAFKVSSKIDSRTILDIGGAEQLIGKGDMLVSYNGELTRLQCAFVDTPEVDRVTDFIGDQQGYPEAFKLPEYVDEKEFESKEFDGERDSMFEDAARLIVASQSGSTSLIQRKMKLGYNRAGRIMDQLEAAGIVGPSQGSKPRDVLVRTEADLELYL